MEQLKVTDETMTESALAFRSLRVQRYTQSTLKSPGVLHHDYEPECESRHLLAVRLEVHCAPSVV